MAKKRKPVEDTTIPSQEHEAEAERGKKAEKVMPSNDKKAEGTTPSDEEKAKDAASFDGKKAEKAASSGEKGKKTGKKSSSKKKEASVSSTPSVEKEEENPLQPLSWGEEKSGDEEAIEAEILDPSLDPALRASAADRRNREEEPLELDELGDIIDSPRSVVPIEQPPTNLFVLPLGAEVLFPGMILPVAMPQGALRDIITKAEQQRFIAIFSRKEEVPKAEEEPVHAKHLYEMGTIARVMQVMQLPNGVTTAILQVIRRCRLVKTLRTQPFLIVRVAFVEDEILEEEQPVIEALTRSVRQALEEMIALSPQMSNEFGGILENIDLPQRLADFVGSHFLQDFAKRQEFLETLSVRKRLELSLALLLKEVEMIRLQKKLRQELQERTEAQQREYLLREQLKIIQKELGDQRDEKELDTENYKRRIEEAKMSEEAKKRAEQELRRLRVLPPEASEYNMIRSYLDWLCDLPWSREDKDKLNIRLARRVLDQDHFGLERVKERILEFLAVRKLKPDQRGAILCLSGPPGVGKTSLGQSIARAMGRKFFRFSLGGMRDEAEIKGHRRTYIGAMPGKIIQGLSRTGSKNPVFMLDEIDKIGKDWRGDPASALLEVLDPSQNHKFLDHYLDTAFDLSRVMFIATANDRDAIPAPLLDRMEVIELPGYIPEEKVEIARDYLLPRQLEDHGLGKGQVRISRKVMHDIITMYTREAGVRNLNREIGKIVRKVAIRIAEHEAEEELPTHAIVQKTNLEKYLGVPRFLKERLEARPTRKGSAVGLAWTPVGGDILFFEVTRFSGSGRLEVTGRLGEVMSESARIALSFLKSQAERWGIDLAALKQCDLHLHVPAGAIPKDGPSAGVTIATAFLSLIGWGEGCLPLQDLAMTGEITLMGDILPVGGIREKVVAAASAGVKQVILPKQNEKDYMEVPENIRKNLNAYFVEHYNELIPLVFASAPDASTRQPSQDPQQSPISARSGRG